MLTAFMDAAVIADPVQYQRRHDERDGVSMPLRTLHFACGSLLATLDVHPRVAMRILRHSKIASTIEIYTMVPDKATLAALKRLSDALGSRCRVAR
jgi:hypothetical protein